MTDDSRPVDPRTPDPRTLAQTYFRAWLAKDFDTVRSVLADDATFTGPLGTAGSGDECVAGLQGMSRIMTDIVIDVMVVDGPDVITWYALHTDVADPAPTANWMHVVDGKITEIRATFDARPLAPPSS